MKLRTLHIRTYRAMHNPMDSQLCLQRNAPHSYCTTIVSTSTPKSKHTHQPVILILLIAPLTKVRTKLQCNNGLQPT